MLSESKGIMAKISYEQFNDTRRSLLSACKTIKTLILKWKSEKPGLYQLIQWEDNIIIELPNYAANVQEKLDGIMERLSREHVKISFFGRNSCGKSTVINALLGSDVLPMGMGHVTNCFVHVQGTDEPVGYFVTENEPDAHTKIELLSDVANALQDGHAPSNSVVEVYLPKLKCPLLARDLLLIDSPGSAINKTFDAGIKKHCQDSDVFIVVLNAECIISEEELDFFRGVKEDIFKANVFIIINRWDLSDNDKNRDKVRRTHVQSCADFLVTETHVSSRQEAEKRIFFVSADEILNPPSEKTEARRDREDAFTSFARIFDSFKSTAFRLKMEPHVNSALEICNQFIAELDQYSDRNNTLRSTIDVKREELRKSNDAKDNLNATKLDIATGIQRLEQTLKQQISDALGDARNELLRKTKEYPFNFNNPTIQDVEVLCNKLQQELRSRLEQCRNLITLQVNKELRKMTSTLTSHVPIKERTEAHHESDLDIEWTLDIQKELHKDVTNSVLPILGKASLALASVAGSLVGADAATVVPALIGTVGGFSVERLMTLGHEKLFRKRFIDHVNKVLDERLPVYQKRMLSQIKRLLKTEINRTYNHCLDTLDEIIRNRKTEVNDLTDKYKKAKEIYQPFRKNIHNLQSRIGLHLMPMRVTSVDQVEPAAVCSGRSEVVTKGFLLAAFCLGLGIVLLYYMWYG